MASTFFYVLFPMFLSAILGWWFGWWFTKRQYEDVTETYDELRSKSRSAPQVVPVTKEELDDRVASLSSSLASIPKTDLSPVESRLSQIESAIAGFTVPETDMTPIYERMTRIDQRLVQKTDVDSVDRRLAKIEDQLGRISLSVSQLKNTDLGPLQTRFTTLESNLGALDVSAPEVDLGPLHSNIAQLELAIAELDLPETDLSPLQEQLTSLELRVVDLSEAVQESNGKDLEAISSKLSSLSTSFTALTLPEAPNMEPIELRLSGVEQAVTDIQIPTMDLEPIHLRLEQMEQRITQPNSDYTTLFARLAGMEAAIDALDRTPVDLNPVQSRISGLENLLAALRTEMQAGSNLEPIARQLAILQQSVQAIQTPDLTPMVGSLRSIDSRLDMAAMENRLTAIEYGLTAVHHMLRSRSDAPAPVSSIEPELYASATEPQTTTETVVQPAQTVTTTRSYVTSSGVDPIASARRPNDESNLLLNAAFGEADDLERISGVGPMLSEMLNNVGVYYFWQVAEWDADDIVWVDDKLEHFKGRIERDNWVGQAREFAAEPATANRPMGA